MNPPSLLDRRLVVVTGKGGVGKSTVSAALALLASRAGKRVLVCEVGGQERVAPLLGAPRSGATTREARPGLFTVSVVPGAAMREYGVMVLRFRAVYDLVFENRLMRYFLGAVPGLAELVTIGKILHEVKMVEDGRPRWDLVILDAPATGHAVQLLRVPAALMDTVPAGPLRHDAEWMRAILEDPGRTGLVLVTLPEEMPVNEAIELDAQVRDLLAIPRAALFVNAMPEARFTLEEHRLLEPLEVDGEPLGPAARAATLQAARAESAARELARVRSAIDLPATVLPLLARAEWGPEAVDRIAAALATAAGEAA